MTEILIYFKGRDFKPSKLKLLKDFKELEIIRESGEIVKKGLYKDEPSPYGMAYTKNSFKINLTESLYSACNFCRLKKSILKRQKVKTILFVINKKLKKPEKIVFDSYIFGDLEDFVIDFEFNIKK